MNLDQLRVFVAVAERGHVTRAAEGLGMSQSAASAAIKALEHSCGVRLFNRVGRSIELSHVGRRFLPEAKAILDRADAARLFLDNASQTITGAVSIAASQTIASYWLPRRLASFHEIHPSVRLDVTIGNTTQVAAAVLDGTADMGLVEGRTRSDLLKRIRVDTDRLVMVFAADAAAESASSLVDPLSFRWIVRERGPARRWRISSRGKENRSMTSGYFSSSPATKRSGKPWRLERGRRSSPNASLRTRSPAVPSKWRTCSYPTASSS
jgi:DNA-binding transcriptional LysR family regulator